MFDEAGSEQVGRVYGVPTDHPSVLGVGEQGVHPCVGHICTPPCPQALVVFHGVAFIHGGARWLRPGGQDTRDTQPALPLSSQGTKQNKTEPIGPAWEWLGAGGVGLSPSH